MDTYDVIPVQWFWEKLFITTRDM